MPGSNRAGAEQMLADLKAETVSFAEELVPWFYANMPGYYFRTHSREEQLKHLRSLISGQVTAEKQKMVFRSPCGTKLTFISPGGGSEELVSVLDQLAGREILNARMYSSRDGKLRLDSFVLGPQKRVDVGGEMFRKVMARAAEHGPIAARLGEFSDFMGSATADCVEKFDPQRAERHFRNYREVSGCDCVIVTLEPEVYPRLSRIIVTMTTPPGRGALKQVVKILARFGISIERAYADVYEVPGEPFAVISVYCTRNGEPIRETDPVWPSLKEELVLCKWQASHELERFAEERGWSLRQVYFIQAACEFAHQFLLRGDLYAYNAHNVVTAVLKQPEIAEALLAWFEARFDPWDEARRKGSAEVPAELRGMIEAVTDDVARNTLECIEVFIADTLRTNYFLPEIFGLAFRMDPGVLERVPLAPKAWAEEERPFGFYFFHGPHFLGFHVRYRETSRGGVRVVPTRRQEIFEIESNRLFDEVTALARSQQYKNKDIPEGGSKAVLLLGPEGSVDLAVKSMVNSLLDLVLTPADPAAGFTIPGVADYLGREEIIYLGPDEHISRAHIEWIVGRARLRGYKWASAFMSSKPRTGINHKQYGVTSLGVVVFAEEILKHLGIDPRKQRFTVKLTGGPAGDVAGNALKVLHREYGEKARVVAMSDGHGAAFDPEGLDWEELLRLADEEKDICAFDSARLKGEGALVSCILHEDGVRLRDTMHNRAAADLFIPAGGRPETINAKNWRDYLHGEEPSSRAIVEGANIFLSQEARDRLEERGVLIVHGASANKTGVICSSYEILAGLTLSDEEFLEVKERYVAEVLEILAERARAEARLLLREYKACGGCRPLTAISLDLSREINHLADVIRLTLEKDLRELSRDPEFYSLALSYCPPVLSERFAGRFAERVPMAHQFALVSAYAASKVVYAEGLEWPESVARVRDMSEVVRTYLRQEKKLAVYLEALRGAGLADGDEIGRILDGAGRKYLTGHALGIE
jgi:glutamate dehydrogenase